MRRFKRFALPVLALLLVLALGACSLREDGGATATPSLKNTVSLGETSVPEAVEELNLAEGEYEYETLLAALPRLTLLETLRLPETELTAEQLAALERTGVTVEYTVALAGQVVDRNAKSADLSALTTEELPAALEKLALLPQLERLTLTDAAGETRLGPAEIAALRESVPQAAVEYSVRVGNQTYSADAVTADLSGLETGRLAEALEALKLLPDLTVVELMDAAGSSPLSPAGVKQLMDALPGVKVHYEFELFGQRLSTLDQRVEFDSVELSNDDASAIRAALDILPDCTYFKLDEDHFGIDNEVMASIRDDYPNVKLVWRVWVGYLNMLTDEEILRISHIVTDENCGPLKYCTDAVYIDLGHNSPLTDISYTAYMPRLECLIVSGSSVADLSPLANCPNLTWLELCYCGWVKDLSPLDGIPNLKYLNIAGTWVTDLTPLDGVALERFVAMQCHISAAEQQRFVQQHPDCLYAFEGIQPYGYPWRYNAGPMAIYNCFEYYKGMRELFCYYDGDKYYGNHKNSEYGDGYIALRQGTSPEV